MNDTCPNCRGEGLAGAGDSPWLKQGLVKTCGQCNGTGKIASQPVDPSPEPENLPDAPSQPDSSPSETSSGGNSGSDGAPAETAPLG